MTPRAPMCLLAHTVSAAPAWVASQSPPGCLPSLVTCVFCSSLHKNVSAGPGPLSTPLLMQHPRPPTTPPRTGSGLPAAPCCEAKYTCLPLGLAQDGRAPGSVPPPPHLPSHPLFPAPQLPLFLLEVCACAWGWRVVPSSAQLCRRLAFCCRTARSPRPRGSQAAGACGELARGAGCALGREGKGLQLQAPALSPHHMEAGAKGTT